MTSFKISGEQRDAAIKWANEHLEIKKQVVHTLKMYGNHQPSLDNAEKIVSIIETVCQGLESLPHDPAEPVSIPYKFDTSTYVDVSGNSAPVAGEVAIEVVRAKKDIAFYYDELSRGLLGPTHQGLLTTGVKTLETLITAAQKPGVECGESLAAYEPGKWFHVHTVEEMSAFYMSRLPAIRAAAKEVGYALGLHGSTRRDLDLMAMPWREDHADKDTLTKEIQKAACGFSHEKYQWEKKHHGRLAVSFPICWTADMEKMLSLGHIDLSVSEYEAARKGEKNV